MKLTLSLLVLTLNLLSVNFFVANAQTTRGLPRSGGSPLGPNLEATGTGGGAITGAYSFNGPFTTVNATNVFLNANISNLALNPPITNLNDQQFVDEGTIATIKSGSFQTNNLFFGSFLFTPQAGGASYAILGLDINSVGSLDISNINGGYGNFVMITNRSILTNLGPAYIGGGMSVGQGITNTAGAISSAIYKIPGTATNMFLMLGGNGNIVTGRIDAATMAMSSDGILSSTVVGGAGGTNFNQIRLDGEIYNITNAGNNTTVTADWNGPHWMRLQLSGTTTISFTNLPAASSTNGQIYVLELYAPSTVPTVTIQNIDPRAIDWGKIGVPVLVDSETNLLVIRYDGTNFLGRSWQDKTVGTITSPYVLEKNSDTSNHTHFGVTSLTNLPGDGSPELRLKATNGNGYISLSMIDNLIVTQKLVFNMTNPAQNEILKIQAVAHSGGLTTITLTNGVDSAGSGSPGGNTGDIQFNESGALAGTNDFRYARNFAWLYISNLSSTPKLALFYSGTRVELATTPTSTGGGQLLVSNTAGPADFRIVLNGSSWYSIKTDAITPLLSSSLGGQETPFQYLYYQRHLVPLQHFIGSDMTLTNFDLSLGDFWAQNTNLVVDMMIAVTNPIPGDFVWHFIGRTNAAVNHTLMITNAPGVTLNWMGSSTNGPVTLTVYSNSFLKITGSVSTNTLATNVYITWLSDSGWPQRNITAVYSAGAGQSNITVGGMYYYDQMPGPYTNCTHTNFANAIATNLAWVNVAANTLTNFGDTLTFIWRGRMGNIAGTNELTGAIGNVTNGLGYTGVFTNNPGAVWEYKAEVECKGPTNHYTYWEFKISKTNSICNGFTNGSYNNFSAGILTNGVTNYVRLQGRSTLNHSLTNEYFRVIYQPASVR